MIKGKPPSRIAVIGAGPAGVAASIQLKRQGFDPVVYDREPGVGLARSAHRIDNLLGFPGGISGRDFTLRVRRQLARYRVRIARASVTNLDFRRGVFRVATGRGEVAEYDRVIVATGTRSRPLPAALDGNSRGRLFYEIGPLLRKRSRHIAIVGAGDIGCDYALSLSRRNFVTILNRRPEMRCLPALGTAVRSNRRIAVINDVRIARISFSGGCLNMKLQPDRGAFKADYLLVAVGRQPACSFFDPRFRKKTGMLMKKEMFFLCGDVKNGRFRQISIAAGDGIRAALVIARAERDA